MRRKINKFKAIIKSVKKITTKVTAMKTLKSMKRVVKRQMKKIRKKTNRLKKKLKKMPKKKQAKTKRQIKKRRKIITVIKNLYSKMSKISKRKGGRRSSLKNKKLKLKKQKTRQPRNKKVKRLQIKRSIVGYTKRVVQQYKKKVALLNKRRQSIPKKTKTKRTKMRRKINKFKAIIRSIKKITTKVTATKTVKSMKRVVKRQMKKIRKKTNRLKKKLKKMPKKRQAKIKRRIKKRKKIITVVKKIYSKISKRKGGRRPSLKTKKLKLKQQKTRQPKNKKVKRLPRKRSIIRSIKRVVQQYKKKVALLNKKQRSIPKKKKTKRTKMRRKINKFKAIIRSIKRITTKVTATKTVKSMKRVVKRQMKKIRKKTNRLKKKLKKMPRKKQTNTKRRIRKRNKIITVIKKIYNRVLSSGSQRGRNKPRSKKDNSKKKSEALKQFILMFCKNVEKSYRRKKILLLKKQRSVPKTKKRRHSVISRKISIISYIIHEIQYITETISNIRTEHLVTRFFENYYAKLEKKSKTLSKRLQKVLKGKRTNIKTQIIRVRRIIMIIRSIHRRIHRGSRKPRKPKRSQFFSIKQKIFAVIRRNLSVTVTRLTKMKKSIKQKPKLQSKRRQSISLCLGEIRRLKEVRRIVTKRKTIYSLKRFFNQTLRKLKRNIKKTQKRLRKKPKSKQRTVERLATYQRRRTWLMEILQILGSNVSRPTSAYEKDLIKSVSREFFKAIKVDAGKRIRNLQKNVKAEKGKDLKEIERFTFEIQFYMDVIHYADYIELMVHSCHSFDKVEADLNHQVRTINIEISTLMKTMDRKFFINKSKLVNRLALLRRERILVQTLNKKLKIAAAKRRDRKRNVFSVREFLLRYIKVLHIREVRLMNRFRKAQKHLKKTTNARKLRQRIQYYEHGVKLIRKIKIILFRTKSIRRFGEKIRRLNRRLIRKRHVMKKKQPNKYLIIVHEIWIVRRIRRRLRAVLIIKRILRQLRRYKRITIKQRLTRRSKNTKSFRPGSNTSRILKTLGRRMTRISQTINRLFRRLGRRDRRQLFRRYSLLKKIITRGIRTIIKRKKPKTGSRHNCCADILKTMKKCHCCHRCCYHKACCNTKRSCPDGFYLTKSRGRKRCVKRCKRPYIPFTYKGKWYCRRPCQIGYKKYGPKCKRIQCPKGYKLQIRMKKVFCVKKRCPRGFFRVKGKGTCIKIRCPKGYKMIKGKCIAKKCKRGYKRLISKKGIVCVRKVCGRGYKLNKKGDCAFNKCPRGYSKKRNKKNIYCIKRSCKVGYRKYKTKSGKKLCVRIICPVGHKVVKGHCKFTKCPHGKMPLRFGKRVFCVKKLCPNGRLLNKFNKCVKCPIGYYPVKKDSKKSCDYRGCPNGYYSVGKGGKKQCLKMPRCYYPSVRRKTKGMWMCMKFKCPRFHQMKKSRSGRPYCVRIACPLGYQFSAKRGCRFKKCPRGMATVKVGRRYHCVAKCATGYRRRKNSMKCLWHGCPRGFNMFRGKKNKYCVRVTCKRGYKRILRKKSYLCIQIVCRWGCRVEGSKCVLYKCRSGSSMTKDKRGILFCKKKTCPRNQMKVSGPDGSVYCVPSGCAAHEKMIDGICMAVGKMDIKKQRVKKNKKATLKSIGAKVLEKSTIKTSSKELTIMTKPQMKIVCSKLRLDKIDVYFRNINDSMRILKRAVTNVKLKASASSLKKRIDKSYSSAKTKVAKLLKLKIKTVVKKGPYKKIMTRIRLVKKAIGSSISTASSAIKMAKKKKGISRGSYTSCRRRLRHAKRTLNKKH